MTENFKEYELKFKADNISLLKFKELMESNSPVKFLEVSSHDVYYTNSNNEFIRFRKSETKPEWTIKKKVNSLNNNERIEVNVPVSPKLDEKTTEAFCDLLGYKKNFKIFKSCSIYFFDNVDIVYYICYNEDMKELDRFIEVEYLEGSFNPNGVHPLNVVMNWEEKLAPLGITPKNRLKKSLFEFYGK